MFKHSGMLAVAVLLLAAGCAAPPGEPVPREWSLNAPPAPPAPRVTARPVVAPPPARVTAPLPNWPAPPPTATWISLDRWAQARGLAPARRLTDSPLATYALRSPRGEMILAIGSREAAWNGRQLLLGFDPEMVDGGICLHSLDLEKNLAPLLCGPPLEFGPGSVVVLDPGHGGMNSGTQSVLDQRPEKEFTLDLARRIKPLLEADGWRVYLTRTNDEDLALSNRVQFAEQRHADVFISLHFNSAAPDRRQAGLETYCLTPAGMPSTLTRGFADPWQENLPNNYYDAQNVQLAMRVQAVVAASGGEDDRGVRRARFIGVLRGQRRPAILIEAGYLSNPVEAAKIENPRFRERLARAIAGALASLTAGGASPP